MRLSTRLTIAMVSLVLLTASAGGLLTSWSVLALTLPEGLDRNDAQARVIATVLGSSAVVALGAVLGALALAVALARSLTKPLVQMTEAVKQFSGEASIAMPAGGGREISALADAFQHMAAVSHASTAALRQEVEERRRVFDTSPDLILVTDHEGNFTRVSPSSETILGYRPEQMTGHSAAEFINPDDLERTRKEMRLARRGRIMGNFETAYVHRDGRVVTLAWTGVWSEPARQHFFTGRDTTEQRLAEARVREQEELLGRALNNMHHGLLIFDRNARAVVINRTYIEMYRLSPELAKPGCKGRELLRQRAESGTFRGDIDAYIENEIFGGHAADTISEIPDGRSIRVVNRLIDSGGWVSTHEDVTQRQQDEAALRQYVEREQLFIAAVESSNDAIVTETLDGVITGWNPAAERLFGFYGAGSDRQEDRHYRTRRIARRRSRDSGQDRKW